MNLTRALEVALPDIPARKLAESYPRPDPGTTFREHIEDGRPMVRIYVPCSGGMYTFEPQDWQLAQLFDGERSYEEIAVLFSNQTGTLYDVESVREFAGALEAGEFWYKTPQEKNVLYLQQSLEERRKKLKTRSKWADLSEVTFPAFNPDWFFTWIYRYTAWIYRPWFVGLTLIGFAISLGITVSHWREIGRDTIEFYNFANRTWLDVFWLYVLGMFVVALHESAHAHACKHYGGRVPAMGFALIYLTPAFYTDTTEGSVKGTRSQRLVIALAGIWSELMLCSIATPIWWSTPPQTLIHDGAYFLMMLTGLMSLVVNWNPLIKLDGYAMLCEIIGISDLKENSTAYTVGWVKKYIWRLPVEVPYVPKRRRAGFAVYALLSGAYSYTVLYVVARFAGNFVRNFSPEWGFIPEIGVALLIFRSRIRLLVNFMKFVYLDKKDRIIAWFTPQHTALAAVAIGIFLALPLWRESVLGTFSLEPSRKAVVRARVPGTLTEVLVTEGQEIEAGAVLARLSNLPLQSEYEDARAKYQLASSEANAAALHFRGYGEALQERERLKVRVGQLSGMAGELDLRSPIAGAVVTPRVGDLLGAYLTAGHELLEIADLRTLRARVYISEYDMAKIRQGAPARLQVEGRVRKWDTRAEYVAARPTEKNPVGEGEEGLRGLNGPHFFLVDLMVGNPDGMLRPGITGVARIYGRRRSLAGMGWEWMKNFLGRKFW